VAAVRYPAGVDSDVTWALPNWQSGRLPSGHDSGEDERCDLLAQDQGRQGRWLGVPVTPRAIASRTDAASSWQADKATGLMPRRAATTVHSGVVALSIPVSPHGLLVDKTTLFCKAACKLGQGTMRDEAGE